MKIGIVSEYYRPWPGGISEHVHHEAEGLRGRGHDVAILTGPASGVSGDGSVPDSGYDDENVHRIGFDIQFNSYWVGQWLDKKATSMGHAEYAVDGADFYDEISCPFKTVEEVYEIDFFETYGTFKTSELVPAMRDAAIDADDVAWTKKTLSHADLTKFAKYLPGADRARGDLDEVEAFVERTRFRAAAVEAGVGPGEGDDRPDDSDDQSVRRRS